MDIAIVETLNGGDLQLSSNDLTTVPGIENMPYLAMFGGNPGYPTKSKTTDVQNFDWWGNSLLMRGIPEVQLNSLTEQKLKEVSLNSSGRIEIENIIKKDLSFLKPYADITVSAVIESDDRLKVTIKIVQNNNSTTVKVVNFRKKLDGDFVFSDFNDDFYVG